MIIIIYYYYYYSIAIHCLVNSAFPSTRINPSRFTKEFHGGEELNEALNNFLFALLGSGAHKALIFNEVL